MWAALARSEEHQLYQLTGCLRPKASAVLLQTDTADRHTQTGLVGNPPDLRQDQLVISSWNPPVRGDWGASLEN